MRITTVGLDADDTLWHNETLFRLTQDRFRALMADVAAPEVLDQRLAEIERRNLRLYGYGVKGFTLSMLETVMELTGGEPPGRIIADILAAGREMLSEPVEPLPGVDQALAELSESYRLVLITKGDLLHQEQKLAASGLGDLFVAVEIVSEKDAATYERVLASREGLALVPLVNDSCGGCHMVQPPQVVNEVSLKATLVTCENCNRILYVDESR